MKSFVIALFAFCCIATKLNAQVKPYLAVVKTNAGSVKGVFYKIDSSQILIDTKQGFTAVQIQEIKKIEIRKAKKNYRLKKVFKYKPYDDSNYELDINGNRVRKWGEEDPTLKEQIAAHVGTGMLNLATNIILFPLHSINPNVQKVCIKNPLNPYQELEPLASYSIYYQENPNTNLELEQLKIVGKRLSLE